MEDRGRIGGLGLKNKSLGKRSLHKLQVFGFDGMISLQPKIVQTWRLTRDDKSLFAAIHNRDQILNKRFKPAAEPFVMVKAEEQGRFEFLIFGACQITQLQK